MTLFFSMAKVGLFTFGGGYAMLAFLENAFVTKHKMISTDEFLSITAIAESTPGPISINIATYVGYKQAGLLGALTATLGLCLPSFVIVYVISLFFDNFLSITLVAYAFRGIQVCVVYLILSAAIKLLKQMRRTAFNLIAFGVSLALMVLFSLLAVKLSTIVYILVGGTLGIVLYYAKVIKEADEK